ncbi:MAG TPA: hypothetical protein VGF68_13625 [Solirubrobacteraceae bacterium]
MTAARELVSSGPGPVSGPGSERGRARAALSGYAPVGPGRGPSPLAGDRALARAAAEATASRTLGLAEAAATRTLARCPGCGGQCGGTCGHGRSEPDEELMASGQRALRRAVLARRGPLSPRS